MRACTVFTRCLQDLSQHVYFSFPHLLTATGPLGSSGTLCALNSMVVCNGTTLLPADKRYPPAGFTFSQMYGPGGQQIFKAGNFSTTPPRPASVSISRMLRPLRSKSAPEAGKGDSVVATHWKSPMGQQSVSGRRLSEPDSSPDSVFGIVRPSVRVSKRETIPKRWSNMMHSTACRIGAMIIAELNLHMQQRIR